MCMVYIKIFQNFVSFNIPIDKKNFYLASEHSRYSGYSVVFFRKNQADGQWGFLPNCGPTCWPRMVNAMMLLLYNSWWNFNSSSRTISPFS